jgi:methyltransferase (TIGR00027 family)
MPPSERSSHTIEDVSDTALWVANYRAAETERPDALFRDPLAARLIGERGRKIAENLPKIWRIDWVVVVRTCIIDDFIRTALAQDADTILNLGAGLDTRPYRMDLPATLRWIEVDYPHMIELKEDRLREEKPRCQLERVKLDLADLEARRALFSRINAQARKVLVITEGVIPYLTNEQTASLARDLRAQDKFRLWVVDYMSHAVTWYLRRHPTHKTLQNAPFVFDPRDWFGFFKRERWQLKEMRYTLKEADRLGRSYWIPWWARLAAPLVARTSGYAVLETVN